MQPQRLLTKRRRIPEASYRAALIEMDTTSSDLDSRTLCEGAKRLNRSWISPSTASGGTGTRMNAALIYVDEPVVPQNVVSKAAQRPLKRRQHTMSHYRDYRPVDAPG